jgi:hypothetical protein
MLRCSGNWGRACPCALPLEVWSWMSMEASSMTSYGTCVQLVRKNVSMNRSGRDGW